ncbi:hypothetical protein P4T04_06285 [Bacillus badius]|uniref:hypothetical protein n=1 Tax=Bacillus badius TaxID=1455 RepID=UPI002E1C3DCB|nr:hypothetical protein [Bacillus badius]
MYAKLMSEYAKLVSLIRFIVALLASNCAKQFRVCTKLMSEYAKLVSPICFIAALLASNCAKQLRVYAKLDDSPFIGPNIGLFFGHEILLVLTSIR